MQIEQRKKKQNEVKMKKYSKCLETFRTFPIPLAYRVRIPI